MGHDFSLFPFLVLLEVNHWLPAELHLQLDFVGAFTGTTMGAQSSAIEQQCAQFVVIMPHTNFIPRTLVKHTLGENDIIHFNNTEPVPNNTEYLGRTKILQLKFHHKIKVTNLCTEETTAGAAVVSF